MPNGRAKQVRFEPTQLHLDILEIVRSLQCEPNRWEVFEPRSEDGGQPPGDLEPPPGKLQLTPGVPRSLIMTELQAMECAEDNATVKGAIETLVACGSLRVLCRPHTWWRPMSYRTPGGKIISVDLTDPECPVIRIDRKPVCAALPEDGGPKARIAFFAINKCGIELLDRRRNDGPPREHNTRASQFRKEGEYWSIIYQGTTVRLKHMKGLNYIAYLLKNPGEEIGVKTLHDAVHGRERVTSAGRVLSTMSDEQLGKQNLSLTDLGHAGEAADADTIERLWRHLRECEDELAEAEKNNDIGRKANVQQDIGDIKRYLNSVCNRMGVARTFANAKERNRKAVTSCISRALERIKEEHPALWHHLVNAIRTGMCCSYKPEQPPGWDL